MDMIYFDHAATTRVLPEAAQAAVEAMTVAYGNPSSLYALGTQAAKAVAEHRATVAQALGVSISSAYELMHETGFPALRIGSRIVVPKEKFCRWVDAQTGGDA